jgi:AraC family transcriptional regulator of adaptative response/methylated-DNA-[protein]-cysteine methyltransferase
MEISYTIFDTRFGPCLAATIDGKVMSVLFADNEESLVEELGSIWPGFQISNSFDPSHSEIQNYIEGKPVESTIGLSLRGSPFEIKVWKVLLSIGKGEVLSYGEVAQKLGDKKLSRAVGRAIGKNHIGYLIPCHRVIRSSGELGGYRWGVDRKRAMLEHESSNKK